MGKPISLNLLRYGGIAVYLYSFFLHASYFQRSRLVNNPGPGLFIKNEPLTPLDLKFEKEGGNLGGILI